MREGRAAELIGIRPVYASSRFRRREFYCGVAGALGGSCIGRLGNRWVRLTLSLNLCS